MNTGEVTLGDLNFNKPLASNNAVAESENPGHADLFYKSDEL